MVKYLENWPDLTTFQTRLEDIPISATNALFYRERNSHRGIRKLQGLRKLKANMVNQDFLEEICELGNLNYLSIEGVSAIDLGPLTKLKHLRTLKLSGANKLNEFDALVKIPNLEALYMENTKHLRSINFLADCDHLLHIGVEGSMWTQQKVETLAPLKGLKSLQELFLTNVGLVDKDLSYLAECPKLKLLDCARFAPKRNFQKLRELMPDLSCGWCDQYEID